MKGRELSDEAVSYQAEAFLDWSSRKGGDIVDAFKVWAGTKGFAPADLAAIRAEVRRPKSATA